MGRSLALAYPSARGIFDRAAEVLGFDLAELCFEGPESELSRTTNTQPAILTVSIACLRVVEEAGITASWAAGHSLGEYGALVAAGTLSFEDALLAVRRRGELMEAAFPDGRGAMGAILGLPRDKVLEACADGKAAGVVEPANFNCPGQVVVSGERRAVEAALEAAKAAGAIRTSMLAVSGPFHSSLMLPASELLGHALKSFEFRNPSLPVIANSTADYVRSGALAVSCLVKQVDSPVLWEDSVRRLYADGATVFIELGPGRVLSGLIRRTEPKAVTQNVEDPSSLEKVLAWLKGDVVR